MRSIDDLEIYKDYGLVLTPVKQDKRPVTKDDKWYYSWPDEDLLIADRLGFYHKQSNVFTLDFDDKTYMAHRFICLFPQTFKDGKHIDEFIGTGYIIYSLTFVLFAIYCSQKSNTAKNRFGPKPKK